MLSKALNPTIISKNLCKLTKCHLNFSENLAWGVITTLFKARAIGGEVLTPEGTEFAFTALPTLSTMTLRGKPLKPNHLVNYDEVKSGHIKIIIKEEIRKQLVDILPVKLKMDGLERMASFRINYLPDPEKVFVVNKGLKVDEGSKAILTADELFASNLRGDRIEIELLESPKHGSLRLINYNENENSAGRGRTVRNFSAFATFMASQPCCYSTLDFRILQRFWLRNRGWLRDRFSYIATSSYYVRELLASQQK